MILACFLAAILCGSISTAASAASPFVLPATLKDTEGATVDIATLAQTQKLFVVTLKATKCPICQQQLARLKRLLPRLQSCDATFIVLSPPPAREARAIRGRTGFPFPFVVDEDLELARKAGLLLPPDQITPAILAVDETRAITWTQRGRSATYFGDDELLAYLRCGPLSDA